jgi:hypothetical protein
VNPGNDDFLRAPPNNFKIAATGTGLYIPFETGGSTTAGAGSLSFRFDDAGTLTGIYSNSGSHDVRSTQGDNYRLNSQDFTIRYAQLVVPWLGLGASFKYTDSTLTFEPGGQDFPIHTKTSSTGYDVRLGGLVALGKEWLLALTGGAGWSYATTRGRVAVPDDLGGPVPITFSTFTKSINLRTVHSKLGSRSCMGASWHRPRESQDGHLVCTTVEKRATVWDALMPNLAVRDLRGEFGQEAGEPRLRGDGLVAPAGQLRQLQAVAR